MEQSQGGDGTERIERDLSRVPPALRAHCIPPGTTLNPGGVDKASGLPAKTLRARLREKLEADQARLEKILELRVRLADTLDHDNPNVTLKAIDDLIEHIDGKLDKGVVNKGEPTVVVINGPRKVANVPPSP